ncbi:MAG TPA: acyl-CoA dehydrogenase family protein [Alphaproteobacteria bacterium]|jgi:alkylation response protein AidB-like acyl-CoA dehydrogenase|nr:acyl-CoA dehydrogenase family protein [Alphaproteobacteria bacterium]
MDITEVRRTVEAVAQQWAPDMPARLRRQALDPADFATLKDAGLHLTGVPEAMGGAWHGARRSTRPTGAMFRALARVDPSVALVGTMHPTVLSLWLEDPIDPPADPRAWRDQRERVLSAAKAGHWFGTVSSEPGGGGDLLATRATASRDGKGGWRVTGDKHMGSGSGVTSFMITVAVPEGETAPDIFLLDTRDLPWDGSRGAKLVRAWDGHGMAATQSHAFRFDGVAAERHALVGGVLKLVPRLMPVLSYMFASVTMGILDAALAEGRRRLQPRAERMAAFERVSWTKAVNDIWLAEQAFEAMARAIETGEAAAAAQRGKLAIAELAEASLLSISKAIGGASFSRSAPFGQWSQDVRALGFLRPPWSLAYDRLFEASFTD